jgi:hypothetical protein
MEKIVEEVSLKSRDVRKNLRKASDIPPLTLIEVKP